MAKTVFPSGMSFINRASLFCKSASTDSEVDPLSRRIYGYIGALRRAINIIGI